MMFCNAKNARCFKIDAEFPTTSICTSTSSLKTEPHMYTRLFCNSRENPHQQNGDRSRNRVICLQLESQSRCPLTLSPLSVCVRAYVCVCGFLFIVFSFSLCVVIYCDEMNYLYHYIVSYVHTFNLPLSINRI